MEEQQLHTTLKMTGLLAGYLQNTLSDEQRLELEQWLAANEANRAVLEELINEEKASEEWRRLAYYRERTEKAREELAAEIARRKAFRTRRLFWYRAAAVLLLLLSAAGVIWKTQTRKPDHITTAEYAEHILPGSQKAQLVLSNGNSMELNTGSDTSFMQGTSVKVQQQQGLLVYEDINEQYEEIQFHQLITPKGGEYHLLLEDGTHVWLNAASSIRFPTRFSGKERRVQLTGEAYFEVAKGSKAPFSVHAGKITVGVLGTSFNVKAYRDEHDIETTLISGKVQVILDNEPEKPILLSPNEKLTIVNETEDRWQAAKKDQQQTDAPRSYNALRYKVQALPVRSGNVVMETAWVDNKLVIDDESFETVARMLERKYDVTIHFKDEGLKQERLSGVFEKESIDEVLHILAMTTEFRYVVDGKIIYLSKYMSGK